MRKLAHGKKGIQQLLIIVLLGFPWMISAYTPGFTVGTWSISERSSFMDPGAYGYIGGNFGISPRIEMDVFSVLHITPIPFANVYGGCSVNVLLVTPQDRSSEEHPYFLNSICSLGYIQRIGKGFSPAVFIRITPLALGGALYRSRERGPSIGIIYDIKESSFSMFWNFFLFDTY